MIKSETRDRVARVRFDRIDKKNAITVEMYPMLGNALAQADDDPQVRAVLLHGTAECFTAGVSFMCVFSISNELSAVKGGLPESISSKTQPKE